MFPWPLTDFALGKFLLVYYSPRPPCRGTESLSSFSTYLGWKNHGLLKSSLAILLIIIIPSKTWSAFSQFHVPATTPRAPFLLELLSLSALPNSPLSLSF